MPVAQHKADIFSSRIEKKGKMKRVVCLCINKIQVILNRLNCTEQTLIIEKYYMTEYIDTFTRQTHVCHYSIAYIVENITKLDKRDL